MAFAGTRTQHRMAARIEDAGFELRDMVTFLYDTNETAQALIESLSPEQLKLLDATFGRDSMLAWGYGSGFPKSLDVSKAIDKAAGAVREVIGQDTKARSTSGASALPTMGGKTVYQSWDITAPATDEAKQWQGWGTALKPALEPITVARKPFKGTVAANVLEWGTGAINIDGARVQTDDNLNGGAYSNGTKDLSKATSYATGVSAGVFVQPAGRWPANLIHDGSAEVDDSLGSASRFFYCAKTSRKDRGEGNIHPTVKPTDLMAYLCRLVTPPGGVVLDPFMGSGSTGKAAIREGFRFIGIEMDADYLAIAEARIAHEAGK